MLPMYFNWLTGRISIHSYTVVVQDKKTTTEFSFITFRIVAAQYPHNTASVEKKPFSSYFLLYLKTCATNQLNTPCARSEKRHM